MGETVRFGPLMFRVLRLSGDGRIETMGMSIVPDAEPETNLQKKSP